MLSHKVEDKKNSKSYFPEVNILSFNLFIINLQNLHYEILLQAKQQAMHTEKHNNSLMYILILLTC